MYFTGKKPLRLKGVKGFAQDHKSYKWQIWVSNLSLFLFFEIFFFLIYSCLRWVFVAACGLSPVVASGGYSSLRCVGFSLQWLLLLQSMGSPGTRASVVAARGLSSCDAWALGSVGFNSCGSRALERRLSSCGTRAYLLRSMWDLPGPGIKPVSPALAGVFLTIAPPRKSLSLFFLTFFKN